MAELLVKSGRNVLILGRSRERLEKSLIRLNSMPHEGFALSFACNIGTEADIRGLGKFITGKKFITEYLFNNAGRGLFTGATNSTSELIDAVFEPNLKGLILLTSEILRITPEEEELSVVNIMSSSALLGRAEETIYCAAKWGARGYTEALRTEYKGKKRNFIAVFPGGMKTDFWNVTGHTRDISKFMDPAEVAEKVINAVLVKDRLIVTDLTISRK